MPLSCVLLHYREPGQALGKNVPGPSGQFRHYRALHLAATAATPAPGCGVQAKAPLSWGPRECATCRGGGTAPRPPASALRPQGGEVLGLPACLLGWVQPSGNKQVSRASYLFACHLTCQSPIFSWTSSGSAQPGMRVWPVPALTKGEEGDLDVQ